LKNYNFIIGPVDTDSVSFCKADQSPFSEEELKSLLKELNDISPEFMVWEDDGYYEACLSIKAKNYVLKTKNGEKKYKGSAFKDQKKEPALKELMFEIVDCMLDGTSSLTEVYHRYIQEAMNIEDISRWAIKKSITKKLLTGTRKNETKVMDAIDGDSVQEGDKVYLYWNIEGEVQDVAKGEPVFYKDGRPKMIPNRILKKIDEFDGNYDHLHYVKRVYDTVSILKTVFDMEEIPKYHSSKSAHLLEQFKGESNV